MHSFGRQSLLLLTSARALIRSHIILRCLFFANDFYAFIDPVLIFITGFYSCAVEVVVFGWLAHAQASPSSLSHILHLSMVRSKWKASTSGKMQMDCAPKNGNVRMKNAVSSAVIRCGGWCAKIHYATQLHTEANEKPERRKTNRNKFSGVDDMAEKKFGADKAGTLCECNKTVDIKL